MNRKIIQAFTAALSVLLIALCLSACADDKNESDGDNSESVSETVNSDDSEDSKGNEDSKDTSDDKPSGGSTDTDGNKESDTTPPDLNDYNGDGITLPDVEL